MLKQIASDAGFPNVEAMLSPYAVINMHIFAGKQLFLESRSQKWLQIDMGAASTRFYCLERAGIGQKILCQPLFTQAWGGRHIDEQLCQHFHHLVPSSTVETPWQTFLFIQHVRDYKEAFCQQMMADPSNASQVYSHPLRLPSSSLAEDVPMTLTAFEDLCAPYMGQFQQALANMDPFSVGIDGVILSGGGAGLPWARRLIEKWLGKQSPLFDDDFKAVGALGAALMRTNFPPPIKPEFSKVMPQPPDIVIRKPSPPKVDEPPQMSMEEFKQNVHKRARDMAIWYAVGGAAFALLVSPIPGASSAVLVFLEAMMIYNISKLYHFPINPRIVVGGVVLLLSLSFGIKMVVELIIGWVPLLGWLVKTMVAGGVIYGLSEASLMLFDKYRFNQLPPGSPRI